MTAAERYAHLLRLLDALIAAGKGDDAEADAVRDAMDFSWKELTREEAARFQGRS